MDDFWSEYVDELKAMNRQLEKKLHAAEKVNIEYLRFREATQRTLGENRNSIQELQRLLDSFTDSIKGRHVATGIGTTKRRRL